MEQSASENVDRTRLSRRDTLHEKNPSRPELPPRLLLDSACLCGWSSSKTPPPEPTLIILGSGRSEQSGHAALSVFLV